MKKNNQPFATFIDTKYIPLQRNHKLAGAAALLILPLILFFFVFYLPKSKRNRDTDPTKKYCNTRTAKSKRHCRNPQ